MQPSIILLSGGIDSAVCGALMKNIGKDFSACFIDYGQSALIQEAKAAKKVAKYFEIDFVSLKFSGSRKFSSGEIYGRNLFLISTTLLNFGSRINEIILGIHSGVPYFDCSDHFADECRKLVKKCTGNKVELTTPLIKWNKSEIIKYALNQNLPLKITYSCEFGGEPPCGQCLSCKDREKLIC